MYQITTGTMTDSDSVKTGMYLAIGRLYTGIADCERWPVDRTHVASWLVDPSPAHVRGWGCEVWWTSCRVLRSASTGVNTCRYSVVDITAVLGK